MVYREPGHVPGNRGNLQAVLMKELSYQQIPTQPVFNPSQETPPSRSYGHVYSTEDYSDKFRKFEKDLYSSGKENPSPPDEDISPETLSLMSAPINRARTFGNFVAPPRNYRQA